MCVDLYMFFICEQAGQRGPVGPCGVENARSLYFWGKASTQGNRNKRVRNGQESGREIKGLVLFNIFIFTERSWENIETPAVSPKTHTNQRQKTLRRPSPPALLLDILFVEPVYWSGLILVLVIIMNE